LMGGEEESGQPDTSVAAIEEFIRALGYEGSPDTLTDIATESSKLISTENGALEETGEGSTEADYSSLPGLMGRTDEKGMFERQLHLLQSGHVNIVAFGHTHKPVDGNVEYLFHPNDPRRAFNTGSWMPRISIGELESPRWADLRGRPVIHDVRYLVIECGSPAVARLEPLLAAERI
jgi:hypothetical protein